MLTGHDEKPNTVDCLVLSYVIELILTGYLNLTFIINNALDLNMSNFVFFQVLEGLKKVTLISPADVSFAESRRDALIAIAKYVNHLYFCLILIISKSFLLSILLSVMVWFLKSLTLRCTHF